MKGLIELSSESYLSLINDCCFVMHSYNIDQHKTTERNFSLLKMKYIERAIYDKAPHWWCYKDSLFNFFSEQAKASKSAQANGDKIFISQLSYTNMVLLSQGDRQANPIYIMNY